MIGFLRGKIIERNSEGFLIDVSGVGYELTCSVNTLDIFFGQTDVEVLVHTNVREDAIHLFGFATAVEKKLFNSLLKVTGVGPKLAIKILSGAPLNQLVHMIESGNVKALSSLPKVGKKTAEQLILTLKGKMTFDEPVASGIIAVPLKSEIISALVNLGFRAQEVERVVEKISDDVDLQQGIRQGLAALSGQA